MMPDHGSRIRIPTASLRQRDDRMQFDAVLRSPALSVIKVVEPDAPNSERHAEEGRRRITP